jgi:hypothetical protein
VQKLPRLHLQLLGQIRDRIELKLYFPAERSFDGLAVGG